MASFAQIVDSVVIDTISVADVECGGGNFPESEKLGREFLSSLGFTGNYFQFSEIGEYRGKFAEVGDMYDEEADIFVRVEVEV
jgi:hypothetical protein